jgi:hypothetical protein
MKEVKEEIKREVVDTHIHYEAIDGTVFNDKEECQKYENSAIGVLLGKTVAFTVAHDGDGTSVNPFNDNDDNNYKVLLPQSQEDIDVLNQLHLFPRNCEDYPNPKFTKEHIGKLILMGYRIYDNALDWTWFYELDKVINTMTAGKYVLTPNQK